MAQQRYQFVARYSSGAGTWDPGQIVDLNEDEAAWFNRDVPGCLVLVEEKKPKAEAETNAVDAPPKDRMVRAADTREGAMSHADFKATKRGG